MKLSELLSNNEYPGRGIALGLTPDGKRSAAVYFIMPLWDFSPRCGTGAM